MVVVFLESLLLFVPLSVVPLVELVVPLVSFVSLRFVVVLSDVLFSLVLVTFVEFVASVAFVSSPPPIVQPQAVINDIEPISNDVTIVFLILLIKNLLLEYYRT